MSFFLIVNNTLFTFFLRHRLVLVQNDLTHRYTVIEFCRTAECDPLTVMNRPFLQPAGFGHFASTHHVQRGRQAFGFRARTSGIIPNRTTTHGSRLAGRRRMRRQGETRCEFLCIRGVHVCRPDIGKWDRLLLTIVPPDQRRRGHLAGHTCPRAVVLERLDGCVEL